MNRERERESWKVGKFCVKNQNFVHNLHLRISFLKVREKIYFFLRKTLKIWSLYCRSFEGLYIVYVDFRIKRVI